MGRGRDARKIINHGLGFHKAPFKLCTVHRLLPCSPSRLWRRKYTGLLFPNIPFPSPSPWYYVSRRWSRPREQLGRPPLRKLNVSNLPHPSSSSFSSSFRITERGHWANSAGWRFVWTDGNPLNYIREQDFLDPGNFHPSWPTTTTTTTFSNIQISSSFRVLLIGFSSMDILFF